MEQAPAPNGRERLDLTLGGKTFGIAARDLVPVLLLISGLVGGYLIYIGINERLHGLQTAQEHIVSGLRDNQLKILQHLRDQDAKLLQALREQDVQLSLKSDWIRQLLVTHDYNTGRPASEHLPLDLTAPSSPEVPKGR